MGVLPRVEQTSMNADFYLARSAISKIVPKNLYPKFLVFAGFYPRKGKIHTLICRKFTGVAAEQLLSELPPQTTQTHAAYHLHPWCEPFKQYVSGRLPSAPDSLPPLEPLSMVEFLYYAGEPEEPSPPPRQMSPIAIPARFYGFGEVSPNILEE